jgi:protein gp37
VSTKIDWCDEVWNPTTGCTKGCSYCYAKTFAERMQSNPNAKIAHKYRNGFKPTIHPEYLTIPRKWKNTRRVFVDSMGDLFDPEIHFEFILAVLTHCCAAPQHKYLILTKNPHRMLAFVHWMNEFAPHSVELAREWFWFGVSVTNQGEADDLIPALLKMPAGGHFVSIEPMRGAVILRREWLEGDSDSHIFRELNRHGLKWVICGLMSGSLRGIESCSYEDVADLRDQCGLAQVPFFFKGWGSFRPGAQLDCREYREFPA